MSNHIHLLAVPEQEDSMALAIGRAHMRHSRRVNHEQGWSGHLWANRFFSTALDEKFLWHAVKYVEMNPVRAGMCSRAEDWKWSSARAHALDAKDELLSPKRPFPAPERVGDWSAWLMQDLSDEELNRIRLNTRTGRPSGDESFIGELEGLLKRLLRPLKRGPKAKESDEIVG